MSVYIPRNRIVAAELSDGSTKILISKSGVPWIVVGPYHYRSLGKLEVVRFV